MSKDDEYTAILLEQIRDQNQAVLEAVGQMQERVNVLATQKNLDRVGAKVDTIQTAVTATNKDMAGLASRVSNLEGATL